MTIVLHREVQLNSTYLELSTGLLSHGNEAVTATRNVNVTAAQ
jgi:hypothetical protein